MSEIKSEIKAVLIAVSVSLIVGLLAVASHFGVLSLAEAVQIAITALLSSLFSSFFTSWFQTRREKMRVYSAIHAMIVKINTKIPRERALRLTVGEWMRDPSINFDFYSILALVKQHSDKFSKEDLEMCFKIEKEILEKGSFFVGQEEQTWFDKLDAEYDRLKKWAV